MKSQPFSDDIVSGPVAALAAAIGIGRTEAEDLDIDSGFKVVSNGVASGDAYLQATSSSSGAGGVFSGADGTYDLTVGYFDETDGVSRLEVLLNGVVVDAFDWDAISGSAIASPSSRAEYVIPGIALATGDMIEFRGMKDGGEPLRTDYIDIAAGTAPPPVDMFVVEAEDLDIISGFKVVSNGAASGDETLQDNASGSAPSRASYTVTDAGTFDVTVGYFDENDGVSSLTVLLNGVEIDSFDWDSATGGALANGASAAERTIEGVELAAGDVLELAGFGDGTEPLRIDFLKFTGTVAPPPVVTDDLWYEDSNEIIIALGDGSGSFTERGTGIMVDGADILSGDFDGDGDTDFLKVSTDGVITPSATPDIELFDIETTLYRNDGNGFFTADPSETITVTRPSPLPFDDGFRFKAQDAGDIDNDGNLDFIATEAFGNVLYMFENDGTGSFTELSQNGIDTFGGSVDALIADFDDDDVQDVAVLYGFPEASVAVYLNDGSGGLTFADSRAPSEGTGDGQIVDLDSDGDLDVLFSAAGNGRGIYGYINDGDGFLEPGAFPGVTGDEDGVIGASVAADFDGDGEIEIVSAGSVEQGGPPLGLRVFDVVTTGTDVEFVFKSGDPTIMGNAVAFGDFDNDGDQDVLLTPLNDSPGDPNLTLLLNDGSANFTDAGEVIPPFDTSDFSFAPIVNVDNFDDAFIFI